MDTRHVNTSNQGLIGLPPEVWHGWLDELRCWVEPTTDAPLESIFAAGIQALSLACGRYASIWYGRELFPNLYQVIVGPPGALRKSTVVSRLRRVINECFERDFVRMARGAGSGPGLLELFTIEEQAGNGVVLTPIPDQRVLLDEPEFTSLLKKTRRKGTADLAEVLLTLFDGNDISPRTRHRPIRVERPFFGVITTTTPENLDANLTGLAIESRLMPRFCLFYGVERPPMAYPPSPDLTILDSLAQGLRDIQNHAEMVGAKGSLLLEGDATGVWTTIQDAVMDKAGTTTGSVRAMLERTPVHILKLTLLYALQAGHIVIELDDLQRAGLAGMYLAETAALVPDRRPIMQCPDSSKSAGSVAAAQSASQQAGGGATPTPALQHLVVKPVPFSIAKQLLVREHYLHSFPGGTKLAFAAFVDTRLLGALTLGAGPAHAYSLVDGATPDNCLTLSRLWLSDDLPHNSESRFIGVVLRSLKKYSGLKFLVSYADPVQGHVGTIYQATGWVYTGPSQATPLYDIGDGRHYHSRSLSHSFGSHGLVHFQRHGIDVKLVPPGISQIN